MIIKTHNINHIPLWTIFLVFLFACASVGPTKPNPVIAQYPGYAELAVKNQLLADEIGKLPELQDGVSQSKIVALEKLVQLYNSNPEKFNEIFEEMYQIGLPEVRKYCSPLQALFWLAEDGRLNKKNNPLIDYSLKKLLDTAWKVNLGFPSDMPDEQLFAIINSIKVKKERERYLQGMRITDRAKLLEILFMDYGIRPKMFNRKARKIMKQSMISANYIDYLRWGDFSIVVERVNAPELLDYYIRKNFYYKHVRVKPHTPRVTFSHKWGDCDDLTTFGLYVLKRAGYETFGRAVYWRPRNRGHVGAGIILEDGRYLLVVDFNQSGNTMSGPYTDISDVDIMLSRRGVPTQRCPKVYYRGWWCPAD